MHESGIEKQDMNLYDDEGRIADPDYARRIADNSNEAHHRRGPFGVFPPDQNKIQRLEAEAEKSILYNSTEVARERIPAVVLQKLDERFNDLPIKLFDIAYYKKPVPGATMYCMRGFRKIRMNPKVLVDYFLTLNDDGSLGEESFHDLSTYEGQPEPEEEG